MAKNPIDAERPHHLHSPPKHSSHRHSNHSRRKSASNAIERLSGSASSTPRPFSSPFSPPPPPPPHPNSILNSSPSPSPSPSPHLYTDSQYQTRAERAYQARKKATIARATLRETKEHFAEGFAHLRLGFSGLWEVAKAVPYLVAEKKEGWKRMRRERKRAEMLRVRFEGGEDGDCVGGGSGVGSGVGGSGDEIGGGGGGGEKGWRRRVSGGSGRSRGSGSGSGGSSRGGDGSVERREREREKEEEDGGRRKSVRDWIRRNS